MRLRVRSVGFLYLVHVHEHTHVHHSIMMRTRRTHRYRHMPHIHVLVHASLHPSASHRSHSQFQTHGRPLRLHEFFILHETETACRDLLLLGLVVFEFEEDGVACGHVCVCVCVYVCGWVGVCMNGTDRT